MGLFSRDEQLVLVVLVAALLVGGGLLFFRELRPGPASAPATPAMAGNTDAVEQPPLFVHVCGAVNRPGVYRLEAGARVIDAVAAAGGFRDDAARDELNLAAPVADGERVHVPTVKEVQQSGGTARPGGGKVNINYADVAALERLPGIGSTLAQRIVEYRRERGRFVSIEELKHVPGIGEKKFEQLRAYVTVN